MVLSLVNSKSNISLKERSIQKIAEIEEREKQMSASLEEIEFATSFLTTLFEAIGFGDFCEISKYS